MQSEKISLVSETARHLREGREEVVDIWRHEGAKKAAELALYHSGRHHIGRLILDKYADRTGQESKTAIEGGQLTTDFAGFTLDSPIGIAAGWDKIGQTILGWQHLDSSFLVVGGVPMYAQAGNNTVRLITFDEFIGDHGRTKAINRFGFNSKGAYGVAHAINAQRQFGDVKIPVIAQITANKEMYRPGNRKSLPVMLQQTAEVLLPHVDGIEFGLTSPNTEGMRDAQSQESFLYDAIMPARDFIGDIVPVGFKGDGDGGEPRLTMYADLCTKAELKYWAGINTTALKDIKAKYKAEHIQGGLSGADPDYQQLALTTVKFMYEAIGDKVDIMGIGGVNSADSALQMVMAGASAVGIVTYVASKFLGAIIDLNNGLARQLNSPELPVNRLSDLIGLNTQRGIKKQKTT